MTGSPAVIRLAIRTAELNTDPSFSDAEVERSINKVPHRNGELILTLAADNSDGDTLDYSVTGRDAAVFSRAFTLISRSGDILVRDNTQIDHETRRSYSVTVNVTDNLDASGSFDPTIDDSVDLTLTIVDDEEDGIVRLSTNTPVIGSSLSASLTDADGNVCGLTWQWERSTNISSGFTPISGAQSARYTPFRSMAIPIPTWGSTCEQLQPIATPAVSERS